MLKKSPRLAPGGRLAYRLGMSYEVELKYRTTDHAALAARLVAMGASAGPEITHEDAYLNHPSRDFALTNEALRLRRIGEENRITYKGPRHDGPTKTREEIEVPFGDGPESFEPMHRLLTNLGFRPVAVIRKVRRPFHLTYQGRPAEVVLDVAEGLGEFAEVEVIATSEVDLPGAQQAVLALARELGLTEVERRSYLGMTLDRRRPDA
jgi:adenylate cyclase class 2